MTEEIGMEVVRELAPERDDSRHVKAYQIAHARQAAVGIAAMKDWERDVVADFLDILAVNMEAGVSHIGYPEMMSIADMVRTGGDHGGVLIGEPWLSNRKLDAVQVAPLNAALMRHVFRTYKLWELRKHGFDYPIETEIVRLVKELDVTCLRSLSIALYKIGATDERAKRVMRCLDFVLACLGHRDSIASMATYVAVSMRTLDPADGRYDEELSRRARLVRNWTRLSLAYQKYAADPFLQVAKRIRVVNIDMLRLGESREAMVPFDDEIVIPGVADEDLPVPVLMRPFLVSPSTGTEPLRPLPSQLSRIASRKRAKLLRWTESDLSSSTGSALNNGTAILLDRIGGEDTSSLLSTYGFMLTPLRLVPSAIEPDALYSQLQSEFPWMRDLNVAAARATSMSLKRSDPYWRMNPTVVVGPPGVGKTRWIRRLTEMVGVGSHSLSVAGIDHDKSIRGMERGWSNARPSFPVLAFEKTRIANPIFLVDEVDKTEKAGVLDCLIPMMEPETARRYPDQFLLGNLDLGHATFLFSANDISKLSPILKSRLAVAQVRSPTQEELARAAEVVVSEEAVTYGLSSDEAESVLDAVRNAMSKPTEPFPSLRAVQKIVSDTIGGVLWQPPGPRLVR